MGIVLQGCNCIAIGGCLSGWISITIHHYCDHSAVLARVGIALGLKLYCKRKPLHCIVAGLRVFILQYVVLYCRKIRVLQ